MPIYKIKHITNYLYDQPVYDSINQILLYPVQDYFQKVIHHSLKISNKPAVDVFNDKFGNRLGIFSILSPHSQLNITSHVEVEVQPIIEPVSAKSPSELWKEYDDLASNIFYRDFLTVESNIHSVDIQQLVTSLLDVGLNPLENAKLFSAYIFTHFEYRQGVTSIETDIDDIWQLKAGVCQDFAHMLLVLLRMIKIPARYVSGYICPKHHEFRGEGATHAWVEIFVPDYGWIGIDPTNNCIASDKHVRIAVGRFFKDCTPVKGIFKGNLNHKLEVSVIVENAEPERKNTYSSNIFQEPDQHIAPSFVSHSYADTAADNLYQAHRLMQIQMQQQQ
jgi:transglutaminase-like putative cysteine protease